MRRAAGTLALALALGACSSAPRRTAAGRGAAVADWAQRSVGVPYKFGGRSPQAGFDCSGLAWWAHRQAGLDIPPSSETQFAAGRQVARGELKPGDLVFFSTERRGPSHVGVALGSDRFVHAPKKGRPVSVTSLSETYWKTRYLGARRFWQS
ncbi:MAG: NLP/P60 protein [Elusimicrobia bacterium]|nr:MAG: NLP/P60 protein [Elusimicrobiota bacterium]